MVFVEIHDDMKVSWERPSQRRFLRMQAPMQIIIGDTTFHTVDWSLGGFRIDGIPARAEANQEIDCILIIPFQGFNLSFNAKAKLLRFTQENHTAAEFTHLDERAKDVMSYFIKELARGSMVACEDVIQRIDVPVTPISTDPDEDDGAATKPIHRMPLKTVFFGAFYTIIGGLLFLYLLFLLYSSVYKLQVESAVVTAPLENITSIADGRIKRIYYPESELVIENTPLILIESPRLEEDIESKQNLVTLLESKLTEQTRSFELEKEKFQTYDKLHQFNIQIWENNVRSLEERASISNEEVGRLEALLKRGYTTRLRVDAAKQQSTRIQNELLNARKNLIKWQTVQNDIDKGRFFNGFEFKDNLQTVEARQAVAKFDLMKAKSDLDALLNHRERLHLKAPTAGQIFRYEKSPQNSIKKGETLAIFERNEDREIEVFLSQDEIAQIGFGTTVSIYFPALDLEAEGQVLEIDRTHGFFSEVSKRYTWRKNENRSGRVVITIINLSRQQIREAIHPGLPAVITFNRYQTGGFFSKIADIF